MIGSIKKMSRKCKYNFKDEDPAWIPYDTLIAMMESEIEQWT